jgi:hypothetical protein
VAAGFFANVVLLDFDQGLRETLSREIVPGLRLEDACRYVDDLHLILTVDHGKKLAEIEELITHWLQESLNRYAEGLIPAKEKTRAAFFEGDERPLVRQSRKMRRIQGAISGGFDAIGGAEILDAVQGLVRSQKRYSEQRMQDQGWAFSPIPDVRDETVARFAAGRFRSTFRSLRPLLPDRSDLSPVDEEDASEYFGEHPRVARSRAELDDEARAFALGLIENWTEDPSNVRLLRIGLDLWPAADLLKSVLALLRPFTEGGTRPTATRRVAWYCLSEIFRAGATETGIVEDHESLPGGISIDAYRSVLQDEAIRLASSFHTFLPWYLRQQVLLFLAAVDATHAPIIRSSPETKHYRGLIRFLNGEGEDMTDADFATLAILSRRSFRGHETAAQLTGAGINPYRLEQIAERDPSFAIEILESMPDLSARISPRLRGDLCLDRHVESEGRVSLAEVVLGGGPNGFLRNELAILRFALGFLKAWPAARGAEIVTPCDVLLKLPPADNALSETDAVKILPNRVAPAGSMYSPPSWCLTDERWRFHLGYLLRFILVARQDFTKVVRPLHWKERTATYREPDSHWYQRLYGLYNGQPAFGDDWLPISDWIERLLSALLHWPGCLPSEMAEWVRHGIGDTCDNIEKRVKKLSKMQGPSTNALLLPLTPPRPVNSSASRPLRACVVQTVFPTGMIFDLPTLPSLTQPSEDDTVITCPLHWRR